MPEMCADICLPSNVSALEPEKGCVEGTEDGFESQGLLCKNIVLSLHMKVCLEFVRTYFTIPYCTSNRPPCRLINCIGNNGSHSNVE